MRSRILSSLLLVTVLAPPAIWAQKAEPQKAEPQKTEDTQEPESTPSSETEGTGVVDEATPVPQRSGNVVLPKGQTGRESAPGEVHTVERGDTLWDLSQRYLGSPWYWPKVWSYNPEIANPHWIYPGNSVRFFPAGEEVPSRVDTGIGPAPMEMVVEPGEFSDEPTNGANLVLSDRKPYQPKGTITVMTQGFVTSRELEEAGRIEGATTGAEMLSFPDVAYVRFKRKTDAKVGDPYVAFHTVQQVFHPITGKPVGYLTEFVGLLRVVAPGDPLVKAQIGQTWDAVARGDLVGPYGEKMLETVTAKPNEKEIKGYVITGLVPYLTLTAEHHFLVIDKGSGDGVQVGNTFTAMRQGDPAKQGVLGVEAPNSQKQQGGKPLPTLPPENIALCLVTEVKEHTSNCIITRSIQEVAPGDKVMMRLPEAPTAQR